MKIKSDYVTNSSSTSYVYWGIKCEDDLEEDLRKICNHLKKQGFDVKEIDKYIEDSDWSAAVECISKIFEKNTNGLVIDNDYESDSIYIGKSPFEIGDNQTGLEFKNDIIENIKKMTGFDIKELECIEEASYN